MTKTTPAPMVGSKVLRSTPTAVSNKGSKQNIAKDLMIESPSPISEEQLKELGIKL